MHDLQWLAECPQAFVGGMGLFDRLKTLTHFLEAIRRFEKLNVGPEQLLRRQKLSIELVRL